MEMTALREAAQQALEALENEHNSPRGYGYELSVYEARETSAAIAALRAALAQPDPQDAELSAALGWPGGISDPVLDRVQLLQMVAALRLVAQQALEALEWISHCYVGDDDDAGECASCHERSYKPHAPDCKKNNAITALRAALAESERDWSLLEATQASLREHMAEIRRLRAALTQQVKPLTGLDKGNSPGGWIDDLRTTVKAAEGEKR